MSTDEDGRTWTQEDIEIIAQAALSEQGLPPGMIERIGLDPGPEFFYALGSRVAELRGLP